MKNYGDGKNILTPSVYDALPMLGGEPLIATLDSKFPTNQSGNITGFYSYLKLSIGFNLAALIAGITPDARPTTTATDTDTITGQIENGTL